MRHALAWVVTLVFATTAFAQRQTLAQPDVYTVETALTQVMTVRQIPGASIGIVLNGVPVWSHGYGMADVEGSVVARDTTEYRLASVSKPLSAVAAMKLVEEHKLDLDAPVQQYCPAFPQKQWPVTSRQVLSHTSGIRHYNAQEEKAENTRHFDSTNDALSMFAKDPLEFQPGTKFGYSTYGYTVVGCVIEGASGEKYYDYLQHAVLEPTGMSHTVSDNLGRIVPNRTRGYVLADGRLLNAGLMDSSYKVPGGGLLSDVNDMSQFMVAMMHHKIVSEQTTALMWTPLKTQEGKPNTYGLGFGTGDLHGWKTVAHTGGQSGTSTILFMIPEKQFGVVILTNLEGQGDALHDLSAKIADALLQEKR